jgi:heme A synthase
VGLWHKGVCRYIKGVRRVAEQGKRSQAARHLELLLKLAASAIFVLFLGALVLLLSASFSQMRQAAQPTQWHPPFSREEAIEKATTDVKRSRPEYMPLETRIDSVEAELITLGEADDRRGGGYGPGRERNNPASRRSAS